jgi:hypothetical protein
MSIKPSFKITIAIVIFLLLILGMLKCDDIHKAKIKDLNNEILDFVKNTSRISVENDLIIISTDSIEKLIIPKKIEIFQLNEKINTQKDKLKSEELSYQKKKAEYAIAKDLLHELNSLLINLIEEARQNSFKLSNQSNENDDVKNILNDIKSIEEENSKLRRESYIIKITQYSTITQQGEIAKKPRNAKYHKIKFDVVGCLPDYKETVYVFIEGLSGMIFSPSKTKTYKPIPFKGNNFPPVYSFTISNSNRKNIEENIPVENIDFNSGENYSLYLVDKNGNFLYTAPNGTNGTVISFSKDRK